MGISLALICFYDRFAVYLCQRTKKAIAFITDYDTACQGQDSLLDVVFLERIDSYKERHRKKIIYEGSRLRRIAYKLKRIDNPLKKIPFFRKLVWNISIIAEK